MGEDIGEALGCGGHLISLRRIATDPFQIDHCVTLGALEAMSEAERSDRLMPVHVLLQDHTPVTLDEENAARFLSGVRRRGAWPNQPQVAVYGPASNADPSATTLLGTAHTAGGELIPGRLLSPIEIQQILKTATELTP